VTPDGNVTLCIFGEGKTDIGGFDAPESPMRGVVPILVHTLCGKPRQMRVKHEPIAFLQGKGLWQKVRCAKRKAFYGKAHAAVFVVDSEGNPALCKTKLDRLWKGRDAALPDYPMAVGVAQPCVEAWLLTDGPAIRRALGLSETPAVPERPEELPAPREDSNRNPKAVLRDIAGCHHNEIDAAEKDKIAKAMNDLAVVRNRCPLSFAPFADEIQQHIRPLFQKPCSLA